MEILLNTNCKFQCLQGNPALIITVREPNNNIAKDSQKSILTDQTQCIVRIPLPCSILTANAGGTPTPCQLQQGEWKRINKKLKCKDRNTLTNQSYTQCVHGGIIKPIGPFCISKFRTVKDIQDIVKQKMSYNNSSNYIVHNNIYYDKNAFSQINNEISTKQRPKSERSKEQDNTTNIESITKLYTKCNYENCNERDNCIYFNSSLVIKNDSNKLKAHFQSSRVTEWNHYLSFHEQKNRESKTGNWKIAAHHIISGNQVLMCKNDKGELSYGVLIKLANYFQYDINNALNCIMLPTNESNFGQMEKLNKTASAYEVMGYMKRQWHVGGHQYTLEKETLQSMSNFYQKYPELYALPSTPNFFMNYKCAVKEEMDKLLIKYSRLQCWEKNYHKKRERFLTDLNNLSLKIEKYLLNFEDNPKKSFPFFVSKIAVEYAFDLPRTSKVIVIYKVNDSIRAKRIRLERYLKNELKIVPVEKGDIEIIDREGFIRFCENVIHFIIDSKLSLYVLPFNQQSNKNLAMRVVDLQDENIMNYFIQHANETMAFIQQNEFTYQPIAKVVAERM